MPRLSSASPPLPKHITANRTRYFFRFTGLVSGSGLCRSFDSHSFGPLMVAVHRTTSVQADTSVAVTVGPHFFGHTVTLRTQLHERLGFVIQTLTFRGVEDGLAHDAEHSLGAEIILVVELVHHLQHMLAGQSGIFDLRQLMSAFIHHPFRTHNEAVLLGVVVTLSSGISMRERNLDGFDIQFFGEVDGVADRLAGLARQAQDEVSMYHQA